MKSPLGTIIFNIDTLIGEYAGRLNSKQLSVLESIKTSTNTLLTLVQDILELDMLRAGKIELENVIYKKTNRTYGFLVRNQPGSASRITSKCIVICVK